MPTLSGAEANSVVPDNPLPSFKEMEELVQRHPSVVCVSLPTAGRFNIDYDPAGMSRREVRDFAEDLGQAWETHASRCTMRLQGQACEGCAIKIEKKLKQVPGVRHATASFLNGALSVVFDNHLLNPAEMIDRIRATGVPLETGKRFLSTWHRWLLVLDSTRAQSTLVAIAGAALVTGVAADHMAVQQYLPLAAWGVAYVTGGYSGVRATISSLRMGFMDIDLLMVLAAIGAACIGAPAEGAGLLFLFALSNLLQSYAVGKARQAIAALLDLRPAMALVKVDGQLVPTPVESVTIGTTIVLRPGDRVPMDGEVTAGSGSINQAPVTGESMPVEKSAGDQVFTGTLNQEGSLEIRVIRPASESTLARMISLVEAAQGERASTQKFLEHAEQYYAGGVILFTILLILVPYFAGSRTFPDAFYRAIAVMVVASPCALILSTPAAILSAVAALGRRGILVKGGRHLEDAASIRAVALDKTGTLTERRPSVTDIIGLGGAAPDHVLSLAAQAEALSEHPLGKAVAGEARNRGLCTTPASEFASITGRGGQALLVTGEKIVFGSLKLMRQRQAVNIDQLIIAADKLEGEGKTVICVAEASGVGLVALGLIGLQDMLRPDAVSALNALRKAGIQRILMLTGDSAGVANAIARQAGITEVHAGLMPEDKVRVIKELAEQMPVIMVGDGINDAPALAVANLGIAIGGGWNRSCNGDC